MKVWAVQTTHTYDGRDEFEQLESQLGDLQLFLSHEEAGSHFEIHALRIREAAQTNPESSYNEFDGIVEIVDPEGYGELVSIREFVLVRPDSDEIPTA